MKVDHEEQIQQQTTQTTTTQATIEMVLVLLRLVCLFGLSCVLVVGCSTTFSADLGSKACSFTSELVP